MDGGILAFLLLYVGLAALLTLALAWLSARIPEEKPQFRLGQSLWLCPGCHRLYDHLVARCPQGHQVIEATKIEADLPSPTDQHYSYATEALLEILIAEHH